MYTSPKPFEKPIYVTRPFLPPLEEFSEGLREIWQNVWLTNNGPLVQRFHATLARYLGSESISLFNNGTLALQIALQGMGISGEVITTPFTFVATTHALYWNKIRPVFVDIEPDYYGLDPDKVEACITPWTTAILAVHVYGYPCQLERLQQIADKHGLKLLYDAAHAFGVTVDGKSIGNYGDLSMFSFHATKLFHSLEGGMLMFRDARLKKTFDYLKNFGFENEVEVVMPGTNAKMNEVQALMGLQVLNYLDGILERRKAIWKAYSSWLKDVPGLKLPSLPREGIEHNFAYYPIEIEGREFGLSRDQLYETLKTYNVFTRRYFYPLVSDYACYRAISNSDSLSVAKRVSESVLTLPIYDSLSLGDVQRVCEILSHLSSKMSVGAVR